MLDALVGATRGMVQCPTGGGKTYTFITDSRRAMFPGKVTVVVAPQLLLSAQLFSEFDTHLRDVNFMWRQVSSEGKAYQRERSGLKFRVVPPLFPTTVVEEIADTYRIAVKAQKPLIIFSTYASLGRIVSAGIPVEVVYYDEAHNATASDNFQSVSQLSAIAKHNYFFTATPRYSQGYATDTSGMSNTEVYGDLICKVDFNSLVEQGIIVKPKLHLIKSTADTTNQSEADVNNKTIREVVTKYEERGKPNKILFNTQGTGAIKDIISNPVLVGWLREKGYNVLSIDSSNQGYINGESGISKGEFIKRLNEIGNDPNADMVVFHYSMLGEGIDVKAFNGVVFFRNSLSDVFATQSIGRVIRKSPGKEYGCVTVVEHASDTGEAKSLIKHIVKSLIEVGVPPESFISDEDGRGDDPEVVEELPSEYIAGAKDVAIQFEHSNMLAKLLGMDDDDMFAF